MKISHVETITETKEKEVGYAQTCNKCGKMKLIKYGVDHEWSNDMKNVHLDFGYESSFDGESWSFDLCEECLIDMVKGFRCVPSGFMEHSTDDFTYEEHQKIFDNWKDTGEWEELKFKTYEELKEMNNGWINVEYINNAIERYHPDKPQLESVIE